jgi:hypothetical protein
MRHVNSPPDDDNRKTLGIMRRYNRHHVNGVVVTVTWNPSKVQGVDIDESGGESQMTWSGQSGQQP